MILNIEVETTIKKSKEKKAVNLMYLNMHSVIKTFKLNFIEILFLIPDDPSQT